MESFQKYASNKKCTLSENEIEIEDYIGCKMSLEDPRKVMTKPKIEFSEIENMVVSRISNIYWIYYNQSTYHISHPQTPNHMKVCFVI